MNKGSSKKAISVFKMFLSENEQESETAYGVLCEMGVSLADVAEDIGNGLWKIKGDEMVFYMEGVELLLSN
jgi:hypothetical protein